jgi:transposase
MLADRRDELAHRRVQTVNRLQRLLSELVPGQRKRDLSALQAKAILASVRPRDLAGRPAAGWKSRNWPTWSPSMRS